MKFLPTLLVISAVFVAFVQFVPMSLFDTKTTSEVEIYNFKTGNTYTGKIHLTNKNEMELTGYYGILWFLGRTKTWTRTNK